MESLRGTARGSHARRRSHEAWAPAHRIFLLKNPTPPFDSLSVQQHKAHPLIRYAVRAYSRGCCALGDLRRLREPLMRGCALCCSPKGNRTPIYAVKGRCPNH
jgi:hypothetical protein